MADGLPEPDGRAPKTSMAIATARRTLNHTLTELKRAIDRYAVAVAADGMDEPRRRHGRIRRLRTSGQSNPTGRPPLATSGRTFTPSNKVQAKAALKRCVLWGQAPDVA